MDRSGVERRDKLGEIVGVSLDTEVLAVVGPWLGAEIALGVGDEPISLRDLLPDGLPNAEVGKRPMNLDDGLPGALLHICEANPVDTYDLG
jgi:hypothetical protein